LHLQKINSFEDAA